MILTQAKIDAERANFEALRPKMTNEEKRDWTAYLASLSRIMKEEGALA